MIVIVMGVVGAGKTTVGRLLAQQLGWEFADADDYHPPGNIDKMSRGIPLKDEDRFPWLQRLRSEIGKWRARGRSGVLACSALKRRYRDQLNIGPDVKFVYLRGSPDLIAERLRSRQRHFADTKILASQFADLEEPESAVCVDVSKPAEVIAAEICERLGLV